MAQNWIQYLKNNGVLPTPESPAHCDNVSDQLQALDDVNLLVELSHYGLLKVSGDKALDFLQGLVTCDMNVVTPEKSTLAAYCNQKGRVLGIFRLFKWQDDYYLRLPRVSLPAIHTSLNKYAVLSKINLTDVSDEFSAFGLFNTNEIKNITNDETIVVKIPGEQPRFEIYGPTADIITLFDQLKQTHQPTHHALWHYLDIKAGIPTIYPETQKLFTPHMLNLPEIENAVSFEKGCYRGQEIVARTHFLGKSKQKMYRATLSTNNQLSHGEEIYVSDNDQTNMCGNIVEYSKLAEMPALVVLNQKYVANKKIFKWNEATSTITVIQ